MTLSYSLLGGHSSFTNDLNNLDLMDEGGPAAEATNTFFEDQALNAWDAEGKSLFLRVVSNEFTKHNIHCIKKC